MLGGTCLHLLSLHREGSEVAEPECICGLDDSPNGLRTDIVCPKHDGVFEFPAPEEAESDG